MGVYFVEAVGLDRVKIGSTRNLAHRLDSLRNAAPVELRLLKLIPGGLREEQALHRHFAEYRVHLEWFVLTPLRTFIVSLTDAPVSLFRPRSVKALREVRRLASRLYEQAKTDAERKHIWRTWREWRLGELVTPPPDTAPGRPPPSPCS